MSKVGLKSMEYYEQLAVGEIKSRNNLPTNALETETLRGDNQTKNDNGPMPRQPANY